MDERNTVSISIGKLARVLKRLFDRKLAQYGLRSSEFRFLHYIIDAGPVSNKDIQDEFSMARATVSQQLNRLLHEGYITIEDSTSDGRLRTIVPTDKGRKVFSEAHSTIVETEKDIASHISKENMPVVLSVLTHLIDVYEEELC